MNTLNTKEQRLLGAIAGAWSRLESALDGSLGAIRGISLAEYRLLRALGDAHDSRATRVDLARKVGMTPSGVTRALKPMEKLGIVTTLRSKRDARLAIAALTDAGRTVLDDAAGVVDDTMKSLLARAPRVHEELETFAALLDEVGR